MLMKMRWLTAQG